MNPQSTDGKRVDCRCPRAKHKHGTYYAYNADRCRCPDCRHAASRQRQANYRRRCQRRWTVGSPDPYISSVGTVRRLRALGWMGWGSKRLSEHTGISGPYLCKLRSGAYPTVRRETAAAVLAAYDRLWSTPLDDTQARKVKGSARVFGWLPPLAHDDDDIDKPTVYNINPERDNFIDEIAVAEAITGRPVTLTRAELTHAITTMTGMGFSAKQISERLGTTSRQVTRKRAATGSRKAAA